MKKSLSRTDRIAVRIMDATCILLALLLLACLLYAAWPRRNDRHSSTLLYTVTLPAVREEYVGGITPSSPVLDAVSKRPIGELIDYRIAPAYTQSYSSRQKSMRLVAYPGYKTVTMTIRARGTAKRGGYSLSGFSLYRGAHMNLRLPNFVGTGICTDLQVTPM
jgi:hypothetical protein